MMTENLPFISILMPVYNEAQSILDILTTLAAQDYPMDRMELIIADGMSADGTRVVIQNFADNFPQLKIKVIDNPNKIVPTGLNLAIRLARGEYIVRVDGHTTLPKNYLSLCVNSLAASQAENVGGRMVSAGKTPFGKAAALATSSPFGVGGAYFHYGNQGKWVDTVYLGAWPKTIFQTYELFDEEMVRDQDDEFNYRLRSQGGRIWFNPDIYATYTPRASFAKLFKQYYQYGFWKVRVLQKHPKQMSLRQFVPPTFVLALLVAGLLSFTFSWGWYALVFLIGVYLLANLFASLVAGKNQKLTVLLLLPLAFAAIHISYGLGFLVGLFRFANRWNDRIGRVPQWRP